MEKKCEQAGDAREGLFRARLTVAGRVQGVGFRPFVYRLAHDLSLTGSVLNAPEGVVIEVQGGPEALEDFARDLRAKLPPLAEIVDLAREDAEPVPGEQGFIIKASSRGEGHEVLITPDTATCPDCLAELFDPDDRRYLYPFTNCTNCGPRYTITRSVPYDRPYTSMACFEMCEDCAREYGDPLNRRFHAQPNACPVCGPKVWLCDRDGACRAEGDEAMAMAAKALGKGVIVAAKGLGGFHLCCDACDEVAVKLLRERKNRPHKPLAVMVPDVESARRLGEVGPKEEEWLAGHLRPIVLVKAHDFSPLSPRVAPDTDMLGVMLPYTPMHHVLMRKYREALGDSRMPALVMTSGNAGGEPICLGNREAMARLGEIADLFLFHNRDILIRTDDSVLRPRPGKRPPMFMRRARGFVPDPVFLAESGPNAAGTGPELKCTLCLAKGDKAFVSQHIGDMENLETEGFHREIFAHLVDVLRAEPEILVHDKHPDYMTTRLALETGLPLASLQHHFAHIFSVLAENRHTGPALGLALDGTGLGDDKTVWGGELLFVNPEALEMERLGHLAPVRMPGGEQAVREPWRMAQSYLWELGVREPEEAWPWSGAWKRATRFLPQILEKDLNCPATTSTGRLFDAASAMLGLCETITYEGQAAIRLERIQETEEVEPYPCPVRPGHPMVLDTLELFGALYHDAMAGRPVTEISRRFHLGLAAGLASMAATAAKRLGVRTVGLSGGVMQNMTMSNLLVKLLSARGLKPLIHHKLPPNDGCISLGQAVYGQALLKRG